MTGKLSKGRYEENPFAVRVLQTRTSVPAERQAALKTFCHSGEGGADRVNW
jgi:hypothetical protein